VIDRLTNKARSNVLLKLAPAEAKSFGDSFVGTEHLLLAMMRLD
jgi:hypothetical protein